MPRQSNSNSAQSKVLADRLRETFGEDSAKTICEKLGNVSISSVNYWKRGDARPDYDVLLRICNVYNVSADWLLGRPGAPKRPEQGLEAACACTGLQERTIEKIRQTKFPRELEFLLSDPALDDFLRSFSKLSAYLYNLQTTMEEIGKFTETGQNDRFVVEKTARLRNDLQKAMENTEFARFKVSEATVQTIESIYGISDQLKKAGQVLEQLDSRLDYYAKR